MATAKPDWQVVQQIIEQFQGQTNAVKAMRIVKVLGKRIRHRQRKKKPSAV
jgi:hypothetical protein